MSRTGLTPYTPFQYDGSEITEKPAGTAVRFTGNFQVDGTTTLADTVEMTGTSHMKLPVGTDAQRPGTPTKGDFRYNSTSDELEYYNGSGWVSVSAGGHSHAASDITSGTLAHERGGLEADVSAYSGLVKITGGATSAVTVTSAGEALLDDADASAQRTTLGLGTAATKDTGVSSGEVPLMDVTGYPAADGSQITNVTAVAGTTDRIEEAVRNQTGGTINKGQAVYISGWNAGVSLPEITKAQSDAAGTMPAFGLMKADLATGASGSVVTQGELNGFDTSSWSVGDDLYVDPSTAGALTNTKPVGANLIQKVAVVVRSHATLGVVIVFGAGRSNDIPNFTAADKFWYGGASGVATEGDITTAARSLLDDGTVAAMRTTLGCIGNAEKNLVVESPTASEDVSWFRTEVAITVVELNAVLVGSSTPSVDINVHHSTDRSAAGNTLFSSDQSISSTTSGDSFTGGFDDATIPANSWIWLETSATSGTVDSIHIALRYTED